MIKLIRLSAGICIISALSVISALGSGTNNAVSGLGVIPAPKSAVINDGELTLSGKVVPASRELSPLADILAVELQVLTGKKISVAEGPSKAGDILLEIDSGLKGESYELEVNDFVCVRGSNYNAVAMGTVTLLQALSAQGKGGKPSRMTVKDAPFAPYRGLLVDIARHWHSMESLKQLVVLCRWYKIGYLQLHLTDDESFVFPSKAHPKAATDKRHYTLQELEQLEAFSRDRGVVIVPELEAPGHSAALRNALPQLKCTSGGNAICPGSDDTYRVVETLIGEMCDVFKASPYFHIGCDEVDISGWQKCTQCQECMKINNLASPEELLRYYIVRVNALVKKQGRKTIVWEGFHRNGKLEIPREILVMPFEGGKYYRPDHLVEDGYTLINASWQPLYVVSHRLAPIGQWPPEHIYKWNMFRWEHFRHWAPAYNPIQLPETAPVIGAQMCAWEQPEEVEMPSLRKRLPAMSERLWSYPASSEYSDFAARLSITDASLTRLLYKSEPKYNAAAR